MPGVGAETQQVPKQVCHSTMHWGVAGLGHWRCANRSAVTPKWWCRDILVVGTGVHIEVVPVPDRHTNSCFYTKAWQYWYMSEHVCLCHLVEAP